MKSRYLFKNPLTAAALFMAGVSSLGAAESYVNSVGMKMMPVAPGALTMGQNEPKANFRAPWSEAKDLGADWDEAPAHHVKITRAFFAGATEVTNAQYEQFDAAHRSRRPAGAQGDDAAVVGVTWQDAVNYCEWLSKKEGRPYRLPTEAEWEYMCRAGSATLFTYGDRLPAGYQPVIKSRLAGYPYYFREGTPAPDFYRLEKSVSAQVAQSPANAWGLHDLHGNVEEWCLDWYASYAGGEQVDPSGAATGDFRITRGGAHSQFARQLRSANRSGMIPHLSTDFIGFRVVQAAAVGATQSAAPIRAVMTNRASVAPALSPLPAGVPFFKGPQEYVKIPPGSEGPIFSKHNHDPALTLCPNGDLLALWYSCDEEPGTELAVVSSRLKPGATEWEPAAIFWDAPDRNDHGPAIWNDGAGTLYHFNGLKQLPGSVVRISRDSGYTWTDPVVYSPYAQANEATLKTRDGRILSTLDGGPHRGTIVEASADGGKTWEHFSDTTTKPSFKPGSSGGMIAGIHAGVVELKDGRLLALGRLDATETQQAFRNMTPRSISTDGGRTWTYSETSLPGVSTGQRFTLKRLREGPLLICSFTEVRVNKDEYGKVTGVKPPSERKGMRIASGPGEEITVHGMYAALSFDEGETWPVRRLITPGGAPQSVVGWDGGKFPLSETEAESGGYLAMCQGDNGVIHLITSRNYYQFNLDWVKQGAVKK